MEVLVIVASVIAMFIPGIVASSRMHRNALAIWMLSLFLGWTFLGWVIALVWACTNNVALDEEERMGIGEKK